MDENKNGKMSKKVVRTEGKPLEEQTLKELWFRFNIIKTTIRLLQKELVGKTPEDFDNEELNSMTQKELNEKIENTLEHHKDSLERIRAEIAKKSGKEPIEVGLKPARLSIKPQR